MARIIVEDCLKQIPSRFELALATTCRACQLVQDRTPKVNTKDKPTVTALREITSGQAGIEMLKKVPSQADTHYLALSGVVRYLDH